MLKSKIRQKSAICGSKTVSQRMSSFPCHTRARINCSLVVVCLEPPVVAGELDRPEHALSELRRKAGWLGDAHGTFNRCQLKARVCVGFPRHDVAGRHCCVKRRGVVLPQSMIGEGSAVEAATLTMVDLPRYPLHLSGVPCPLPRRIETGALVDCFPAHAAFPVLQAGRPPHLYFRGLLRLHSRYGPSDRSTAQRGVCHDASIQPVARPNRSSATRAIDNSLRGTSLHW